MGCKGPKSNWRAWLPSAGAARPGETAGIKEVVGADRPPGMRRVGIGGEDQELIVAFDANPDDHDRQVARVLRLARNNLGSEPKRIDVRQVRSRNALGPERRMGD